MISATNTNVSGVVNLRITGAGVDQTIHEWMTNLGGTVFRVRGEGVALNSITLPAAADFGATTIDLQATTINLDAALTVATSVALRADMIAGDDDGVVVIEITTGTLTTTDITDMGTAGTGAPATADSVTSFSLTQSGVFGSAAPFTFGTGLTVILETAATAPQPVQGWMVATGSSLSLTSTGGDITIGRNINLGTGDLTLIANGNIMSVGTPRVVTADTVTLELTVATVFDGFDVIMTGSSFGATAPFATNSDIGTLNIITQADQTYRGWMARTGRNLTITATGGILIGSTAINLGSTGNLTLNASLGVRLTNRAGLTITAGDFTLFAGGLSLSFPAEINVVSQFVVNASGDITTTTITLPGARVELRADNGSIMTTLSPDGGALASILADFVLLRQSVAFPDGLLSRNGNQIARLELRTTTAVDQPIYRWMRAAVVNSPGGNIVRSFSLRGEGDVVLTSITLRAAGFGAGDFGIASVDLQATTINLDAANLDAAITLTGAAISLTGAITVASSSNNDLTITASGVLTLNSGINLGSGILTINADDRINVPNMNTDITASAINIIFTDPAVDSPAAGFTTAAGVATLDNADFIPDPDYTINLGCTIARCTLGNGSALTLSPLLEAGEFITLDAGANALAFNGTGAITITSPTITITAGSIDIGTRSLTITAEGGTSTITLVGVTSITGTGAASLSLDAATIAFTTAPTLNVPSISVAQNAAFPPSEPFIFGMAITSLTLTTEAAQTVQGWMITRDHSLSVTTADVLTFNTGIDFGSTFDLTLNGAGGIVLDSVISITARDITLNSGGNITFNRNLILTAAQDITLGGAISVSGSTIRSFSATATRNLILDTTINVGAGNITLLAVNIMGRELEGNPAIILTGGDVDLRSTGEGGITTNNRQLRINANGNIVLQANTFNTGSAELNLRADEDNVGGGNISSTDSAPRILAGSLFLRQSTAFADDLFTNILHNVTGRVRLRLRAAADQTIHPWMLSLGGTEFSLYVPLGTITLSAAHTFTSTIDLQATAITLGGNLTADAVALRANTITGDIANLVAITTTAGGITATDITATGAAGTGRPALDSTVTALTITQNSLFSGRPFTFGAALASLTLQTAATAAQTVRGWMIVSGRDLSLTSTGGDITIDRNINVGTADLNLTASGNILAPNTPRPRLTAATVNFELTGTDSVFTRRLFDGASQITTLTITTQADQEYRGWMAPPAGTNRNLTITSVGISINSTAINLGTGDLTLKASLGVRLTNAAGLTINARDFTLFAGGLSLSRATQFGNISQFVVNASGDITITSISLAGARVELRADNGSIMTTISPDDGTLASILADFLLMRQSVAFADGLIGRNASQINRLVLRTTTAVAQQPIYEWMRRVVANGAGIIKGFSLRGSGAVLGSITTEAALDFGTAAVDLRATAITLGGALTAGAVDLRTNTITGSGALLAIHAMTGEITSTTITSSGGAGTSRPALAAGVTSISLEQTSAFEGRGTLPFILVDANITAAITLSTRSEQDVRGWMIIPNRNLTITSSDRVTVEAAIGSGGRNLGNGNLTLTSTGVGIVRILADISTTGNITLSGGAGGINFNGRAAKTLSGGNVTLSGNARSDRRLTLDATNSDGFLTLSGEINTGTSALSLNGGGADGIALGGALTLTGGSITLMDAVTGAANLTITADTLTLTRNIILTGTTSIIDLRSRRGAITGSAGVVVSAPTVRLSQVVVFGGTQSPFDFSTTGSLELTTDVAQVVEGWMIASDRNLTVIVRSGRAVRVSEEIVASGGSTRDIGAGNLTLTSGGRVRIGANITTTGNIILTGVASTTQPAIRFENGARMVMGGNIRLNGPAGVLTSATSGASGGDVTLNATATNGILTLNGNVNTRFTAAAGTTSFGDLTLTGATIQIGLTFGTPANTRILLRGQNIMLTSANGIEIGRFIGRGDFRPNNDVANLTVNAQGTSTIAGNITVADDATSGGNIELRGRSGTPIVFTDARTIIGRAIRLRGAATGAADLTITARGTLTIENDINIGTNTLTLTSGVGAIIVGTDRSTLTASTVSLAQVDAFGARPFDFDFGSTAGSLVFMTAAEQDVRGWMIASGRNLAITSSDRVLVDAAIGPLEGSRNIGAGNLSLTSTGVGIVRILANISTTGNITLSGGAGGINFNGREAKTLSGGNVTLSGNARSDRRLTINATSGVLTLSGAINTSTSALSLSGSGGITLGGALTLTGGSITISNAVTGAANLTINVSSALTLNNNITLTGAAVLTLALSGAGALGSGTATILTASTVRLRQVDVFGGSQPYGFGTTGSLELTTDAAQVVEGWMIASDRNLTVIVRTGRAVRVSADIVASGGSARDIGGGNLTLTSGGRVRIGANITTTGNIILTGVASATQPAIRFENGARMVMGGNIRLNGPAGVLTSATSGASGGDVTLNATATNGILTLNGNVNTRFTAAAGTTSFGDLTLTGATIQIGLTFGTPANTRILLRGQNIMLTSPTLSPPSTSGILLGRFIGRGDFRPNNDVANLTVNAQGTSTIAADITVDGTARSGGDIELRGRSGTPIVFTDARTIIGRAIRLRGAATGAADLTLTASGILRIDNDIGIGANTLTLTSGAGAISNGGAAPDARPTLTASTVSLAQVDAFAATRLFTFAAAIDSLEFETTVNQDVLSWMIFENTNLTVQSSARVRVTAAIGSGGRNLGDGDLTLTSTGGTVRIMADITTMGDLTLNDFTGLEGVTGDINFNGGARILNGAAITLTGAARSDRALTIDAMGMLTINNNINIGTGTLDLTGTSLTFGSSVALTAGSHSFTPNRTCNTGTSPSCNR